MTNEIKKILKHTKNMNILYIEDNKEVQFSTNIMFNNFFRKVDLANDGEVGLKLFYKNKNKYDIVFSDIEMPKID
jgi:CheY-like chemotaxis protein